MTHSIEKARDTIRKLLNVAKNDAATEGEVNNALAFAQNLMKRHHLTEEDVADENLDPKLEVDKAKKDRVFVSVMGKIYAWEMNLASFCSDFIGGVGVYRDDNKRPARDHRGFAMRDPNWDEPYQGKRFCFYGIAEEAMLAAELFHELRMTIIGMARLKFGACYVGDGGRYCEGFTHGLRTKIKEQARLEKKEAGEQGLIFIGQRDAVIEYKKTKAQDWLANQMNIKLGKGAAAYGSTGSHEAYNEGKTDGAKADIDAARRLKIGG